MNNEVGELEKQILQTQQLLKKTETNKSIVSKIKTQRNLFGILSIVLLTGIILLYLNKNKNAPKKNNVLLVNKDTLLLYKEAYTNNLNNTATNKIKLKSIKDKKIIYSVQIGAFKDFKLTSEGLMNLTEFQADDFNKFSLGNYETYKEAIHLKNSLIKLGFKGCFLSARSFGNPIGIREALALSNEPQFLEQ